MKVAVIHDAAFFEFLFDSRRMLAAFPPERLEKTIFRCAELHLELSRKNPNGDGFSRPLDFGHWSAHKIEELSGNEIRHGEAVAMGIALDSLYAFKTGLLSEAELHKIVVTLEDLGFDLFHPSLLWVDIEKALRESQDDLGGEPALMLPDHIGKSRLVEKIDIQLMSRCIGILAARERKKEQKEGRTARPFFPKADIGFLLY